LARCKTSDIMRFLNSDEAGNWRAQCGFGPDVEVNVDHIHTESWGGDDSLFNFVLVEAVVNRYWSDYAAVDKSHKRHGAPGWQTCASCAGLEAPRSQQLPHTFPRLTTRLLHLQAVDRRDRLQNRARLHAHHHGRGEALPRRAGDDGRDGVSEARERERASSRDAREDETFTKLQVAYQQQSC